MSSVLPSVLQYLGGWSVTLFLNRELFSRCFLHYIHAITPNIPNPSNPFPTIAFEARVLQFKAPRCYCMGLFSDISGFLFSTLSTFHSGHLHSTCIYLYPVVKLLFTVSRLTTCVLVLKCEQLQGFLIYYLHFISIPDPIFGSWCFFTVNDLERSCGCFSLLVISGSYLFEFASLFLSLYACIYPCFRCFFFQCCGF
jgi:hypothetical protein